MSKKCAKCEKTVYPAEELKCLDKTWHKTCFKCWECGMQLTMKNYKGYNKLPYCTAHYPQTKHTVVAETPESKRLQKITEMNSSVKYHEEFEKSKGTANPSTYVGGGGGPGAGFSYSGRDDEEEEVPRAGGGGGYAPPPAPPAASQGLIYTALFDYEAQDDDEVSFQENDRIVNCEVIDEGWITGTVEGTGNRGMIPANYVERA